MKKGYKLCPYCGEEIRKIAKKCRFCGEFLDEENLGEQYEYICECGGVVNKGDVKCCHCGSKLEWGYNSVSENRLIDDSFGKKINASRIGRLEFFKKMFRLILIECFVFLYTPIIFSIIVLIIATIVWRIPLTIKRCHDIGWSGWLAIVFSLPILPILMCIIPGTDGDNKYGSNPIIEYDTNKSSMTYWKRFGKYIIYLFGGCFIIGLFSHRIWSGFKFDEYSNAHYGFDKFLFLVIFIIETLSFLIACFKIKKGTYGK